MSDKPKTHQKWWDQSAYSRATSEVRMNLFIPTLSAWDTRDELAKEEIKAAIESMQSELDKRDARIKELELITDKLSKFILYRKFTKA